MHGKRLRDNATAYIFLFPGLIFLMVWLVYPMFSALNISMRDWNIMPGTASPFVGLGNYLRIIDDNVFWMSLKNTSILALVTVVGQLVLGLVVALMVDGLVRGKIFFRTLYYLPVVTSWVVVSLLFKFLFNSSDSGFANFLLVEVLHLAKQPIRWLTEANTAFVVIYALGIWKGVGFAMIIFLAALQSIPGVLYHVAAIDGASGAQMIRNITLPLLRPTMILVTVMLTIGAFQLYIPIELITQGGPLHRTEVIVSYVYSTAFRELDFAYSSAQAFVLALIVFGISRLQLLSMRSKAAGGYG